MFSFLCRTARKVIVDGDFALNLTNSQLGFSQNKIYTLRLLSSSLHVKKSSLNTKQTEQEESLTVSYLINSCGFSLKSAVSVSKFIQLKKTDRPDSVLRLLSSNGFSNTQISKVVRGFPKIILADPEKILSPKIEFFRSIGVSKSELPKIIARSPRLLAASLKNHLIPNYSFIKNVGIHDEKIVAVFKRMGRGLLLNLRSKNFGPNIALLTDIGVPQCRVSFLVTNMPTVACCNHSKFCKIVNEVKEMGFNPAQTGFVIAVAVFNQLKESVWESKFQVYRRWGWSEDETLAAFRRYPYCMQMSEEKITKAMDFFVNKMGTLSQDISKMPEVLNYSLEKRIAPRCLVIQVLLSKGLIQNICPRTYICPGESKFIERYVTKFQEGVPDLLEIYQGKTDVLYVSS